MPPKNSARYNVLKAKKDSITQISGQLNTQRGKCWYAPDTCALSSRNISPDAMWEEDLHVYHFHPFVQFQRRVGELKGYKCIHCGKKETLGSNSWNWRPMIMLDKTAWLLHRRLRCKADSGGCGRTFAEFDKRFMQQLPTVVVEHFPFLTTRGGLGLHNSVMDTFMYLCTKGVLFGSFCQAVNEGRKRKYFQDHCSYLDIKHDEQMQRDNNPTFEDFSVAMPFSTFEDPGEYNGILLKPGLLRYLFLEVSTPVNATIPYRMRYGIVRYYTISNCVLYILLTFDRTSVVPYCIVRYLIM